ncbi:hypothetical protein BDV95DRAFT_193272 [Massariosphaeria phaeospora]|uniref:Uncharacterized protein n=1 Tax=Massariosphaeria phaeospora TaxID=100035 RepID=A0A7C8M1E3_9PLEO|nr:hypothetical protein BDV95DRAFT_193272 [Massariosphaeria phaeospora]
MARWTSVCPPAHSDHSPAVSVVRDTSTHMAAGTPAVQLLGVRRVWRHGKLTEQWELTVAGRRRLRCMHALHGRGRRRAAGQRPGTRAVLTLIAAALHPVEAGDAQRGVERGRPRDSGTQDRRNHARGHGRIAVPKRHAAMGAVVVGELVRRCGETASAE